MGNGIRHQPIPSRVKPGRAGPQEADCASCSGATGEPWSARTPGSTLRGKFAWVYVLPRQRPIMGERRNKDARCECLAENRRFETREGNSSSKQVRFLHTGSRVSAARPQRGRHGDGCA